MRARCTDQRFPRTSQYTVGTDVCSTGLAINVHSTPCLEDDRLLYTIRRKVTKLRVLNAEERPGCDKYWLNVDGGRGNGWIISSAVELCRDVDLSRQFEAASSTHVSLFAVLVAALVAIIWH